MTATTIDVHEAQTQLLQLLTLALKGGEVVIAKDNVPLVRLVPVAPQKKGRTASMHKGAMRMSEDFNDCAECSQPMGDANQGATRQA